MQDLTSSRLAALTLAAAALAACGDRDPLDPGFQADRISPAPASQVTLNGAVCEVVSFDNQDPALSHGSVVTSLNMPGFGLNISVSAMVNHSSPTAGTARIYDTDNVGGPDFDLEWQGGGAECPGCQGQNGVLVVEVQRGWASHGDAQQGGILTLAGFPSETYWIESFKALDIDGVPENETIYFSVDGAARGEWFHMGNGTVTEVFPLAHLIDDRVSFRMTSSGAIDDLVVCRAEAQQLGDQGCTLGYWKTHTGQGPGRQQDAWAPTGLTTGQALSTVFSNSALLGYGDDTLLQALNYRGGPGAAGAARLLLMQGVAAVLNARHPDVEYALTYEQIVDQVNGALASNQRNTMLALKDDLDDFNNTSCPLD